MVSHYHYVRHTKWAEDGTKVKGGGCKTYGYDFGNDGYRSVINWRMLAKWVDSKVGQTFDDVWREANQKWDNRTYVGKESLDHISYLLKQGEYSDYPIVNGIITKRPKQVYKYPKRKSSIVYYSDAAHHRYNNIWYAVSIKTPAKNKDGIYYIEDVFLGLLTGRSWYVENLLRKQYGSLIYCTTKSQVSKRVCQRLNALVLKGS